MSDCCSWMSRTMYCIFIQYIVEKFAFLAYNTVIAKWIILQLTYVENGLLGNYDDKGNKDTRSE